MLRVFILMLLLAAPAFAKDRAVKVHYDNYTLRVRAEPVGMIPLYRVEFHEVHSLESFTACAAQEGHTLFLEIRATQDTLTWYMARVLPDNDDNGAMFVWPRDQRLSFIYADSSMVIAKRIIAYPPDIQTPHPIMAIYPGGVACRVGDLETRHMSDTHRDVFIGVRRQKRTPKLIGLQVEGGVR